LHKPKTLMQVVQCCDCVSDVCDHHIEVSLGISASALLNVGMN
jgi:hypothetical protein